MRKGKSAGRPEQFIWQNLETDFFHIYNSKKNKEIICTKDGQKIKKFHLDITGMASSLERKQKHLDEDVFREVNK